MGEAERIEEQYQAGSPEQGSEFCPAEEQRHERRSEEQQYIQRHADNHIGEEHGVVLFVADILLAYQGVAEAAVDNAVQHGVEDEADAYQPVLVR